LAYITTALFILAGIPAILLIHRRFRQAKTASFLKIESGAGIVEERFVRFGGIDQWILIRGEDKANPVLLLIHGGPGCSYSIFTPSLHAWEKYFTIVQWDQRGAGKTFARTRPAASGELSLAQLTRDGIEVAEYLRTRLRKNQIFLLASSFGSTFGLDMARQRPDMFYAYIGTDQNVGMVRGREEDRRQVLGNSARLASARA
jgi:pimeloyl-ACP methyl ester carboxylesterase